MFSCVDSTNMFFFKWGQVEYGCKEGAVLGGGVGGGCLTKKTQQSFCKGTNSKSGMWVITRPSVSGSDTLCLPLVFSNILIIMCYFALVHHLKTKPPVSYLKFCLFNLCVFVSHSAGTLTKRTQRNMKQKVRYVLSLSEKIDFVSVWYDLITLLPRVQVRCISGTPMSRARPGDPSPPCRPVWRRGCARRAASWRSRGPDVPDTLNCSLSVNTWAWRWGSKSTDGLVWSHLFVWISSSRNQLIISCNYRNIYIYLSG